MKHSTETKKKISNALRGHKHSEKTKQKMSFSHKGQSSGNKGKRGQKAWNKGKTWSQEIKQKISKANKGKLKGKKFTNEHKRRMRENHADFKGNKNPFWQGGKSFEPYTTDWTETLKRSIRERDNYICQLCNQYGNTVHHIDKNKQNCNPKNLITVCRNCHSKIHKIS